MIATVIEYEKAQEELRDLEERLGRLQQSNPVGSKGFTKAGIRKMIARLHEELAMFEGSGEARQSKAQVALSVNGLGLLVLGVFPASLLSIYQDAFL